MKERPILFSAPMVRALLEGRKTQTRRVVKPQPVLDGHFWTLGGAGWSDNGPETIHPVPGHSLYYACPYGQPGDKLWVREAVTSGFLPHILTGEPTNAVVAQYAADTESVCNEVGFDLCPWWKSGRKTIPGIHLPRWASRLTLTITDVRVQRLQEITGSDAFAEGVQIPVSRDRKPVLRLSGAVGPSAFTDKPTAEWAADDYARFEFAELWTSINGPDSWSANPWVWALSFEVAK